MNAIDFLDFAKSLDTNIESQARSCVSRSYYCAYHQVKDFIEHKLNIAVERAEGGTHERISKILIQDKNSKLRGLGYMMVTLHGKRVMADYFLNTECSCEASNEALKECEKILKILNEYDS